MDEGRKGGRKVQREGGRGREEEGGRGREREGEGEGGRGREGGRELTSAREHSIVPSSSSSLRVSVKLSMS